MSGRRASKAKVLDSESDHEQRPKKVTNRTVTRQESSTGVVTFNAPRKSGRTSIPTRRYEDDAAADDDDVHAVSTTPRKSRSKGGSKVVKSKPLVDDDDDDEEAPVAQPKPRTNEKAKKARRVDDDEEEKEKLPVVRSKSQAKGKPKAQSVKTHVDKDQESATSSDDDAMSVDPRGYTDDPPPVSRKNRGDDVIVIPDSSPDEDPEIDSKLKRKQVAQSSRSEAQPAAKKAKTDKTDTSKSTVSKATGSKQGGAAAENKKAAAKAKLTAQAKPVDDVFTSQGPSHIYASGVKQMSGPIRFSPVKKPSYSLSSSSSYAGSIPVSPSPTKDVSPADANDDMTTNMFENYFSDDANQEDENEHRPGTDDEETNLHLDDITPKFQSSYMYDPDSVDEPLDPVDLTDPIIHGKNVNGLPPLPAKTGFISWHSQRSHITLDIRIPKVSAVFNKYGREKAWTVTQNAVDFVGRGNFVNIPRANPAGYTWNRIEYGRPETKVMHTFHRIVDNQQSNSPAVCISPVLCYSAHLNQPVEASAGNVKKTIEGLFFPYEAERLASFICMSRGLENIIIQPISDNRKTPIRFETRQSPTRGSPSKSSSPSKFKSSLDAHEKVPVYDLRRNFTLENLETVSEFPPWPHPEPHQGSVLLVAYTISIYHPGGDENKEAVNFNILWAGVLHGNPKKDKSNS
ncbi:hypothetical protein C8J56DRAFT_1058059 [Mycena floridula]|nr:hypothetical protein C8J56DRAFT_1058059 [Mycena floridula]